MKENYEFEGIIDDNDTPTSYENMPSENPEFLCEPEEAKEQSTLHFPFFSQLIEDIGREAGVIVSPDDADVMSMNPHFADAFFHTYLNSKGTIEDRLHEAFRISYPVVEILAQHSGGECAYD